MSAWPEPLIQPDVKKDCLIYSTAYLCHCLGYPEITVEQIRQYRAETGWIESSFPGERLPIKSDHWWHYKLPDDYRLFWLGKEQRGWVEQHLAQGQLAIVCIHRIPEMGHIVVLLESDETGVLLADPVSGHVRENWDWFLGIGPGTHGCHRIEGWYSREANP